MYENWNGLPSSCSLTVRCPPFALCARDEAEVHKVRARRHEHLAALHGAVVERAVVEHEVALVAVTRRDREALARCCCSSRHNN